MIITPGQVNIDMADIQSVMRNAGTAMMGTGCASGPDRAVKAARQAVQAPLLLQSVSHATGGLTSNRALHHVMSCSPSTLSPVLTSGIGASIRVHNDLQHRAPMLAPWLAGSQVSAVRSCSDCKHNCVLYDLLTCGRGAPVCRHPVQRDRWSRLDAA